MNLSCSTASALAAALVAAASVLAFSQLPALIVWAAFIGWASYDHSGATVRAAVRSSAALVFGTVIAWLVAVVVAAGPDSVSATLSTATAAGTASFLIVIASRTPLLSVVPAVFYGFASTFAYLSHSPGALTVEALISPSWRNAIFSVPVSLLIGTALGIVHGWLAVALAGDGTGPAKLSLSNAYTSNHGKP
jgi:Protein of unknown function (DUF1097)